MSDWLRCGAAHWGRKPKNIKEPKNETKWGIVQNGNKTSCDDYLVWYRPYGWE